MKKIHVVVLDTFGSRDDARAFESVVVVRLRGEYPATIVHVDLAAVLRERIVLHAYGFPREDKAGVEEAALGSVADVLESQVSSSLLVPTSDPPTEETSPELISSLATENQ